MTLSGVARSGAQGCELQLKGQAGSRCPQRRVRTQHLDAVQAFIPRSCAHARARAGMRACTTSSYWLAMRTFGGSTPAAPYRTYLGMRRRRGVLDDGAWRQLRRHKRRTGRLHRAAATALATIL